MKTIDCRGLACPGPVIQAKKALEEAPQGETVAVLVDSVASRDNVRRFAESRGYGVRMDADGESGWMIAISGTGVSGPGYQDPESGAAAPPVVFLASDTLGTGDDKLGRILMEGFVRTLPEQAVVPDKLLLMNAGVRLAVEGSPVLGTLEGLTDRGCEILACGTCLDFFGLRERLAVGTVSNMFDIQRAMLKAVRVVRP